MSQEIRTSWAWGPEDGDDAPVAPPPTIEVDLDDESTPTLDARTPTRPSRLIAGVVAACAAFAGLAGTSPGARDLVAGYLTKLGAPTAAATATASAPRTGPAAAQPAAQPGMQLGEQPGVRPGAAGNRTGSVLAGGPGAKPNRMLSSDPTPRPEAVPDVAAPLAPRWALLDDGTWLTASLNPADRHATRPDAVAVDLVLRTASLPSLAADAEPGDADPTPVTTDGHPALVTTLTLQGLGDLAPVRPLSTLSLPRVGVLVVPADLLADCTGWWTGPGQVTLGLTGTSGAKARPHVAAVSLPDRTPADVLTPACPTPRHGVALSLTRSAAAGPGRVLVRVVNHGSRPAVLHLSPGWLDGQVKVTTPGHRPVTLAPGHAAVLDLRVTRVTPGGSSERPMPQAGRTSRTDPQLCHRLSVQLADALSVQASDPEEPDLGLVTAGDIAWGTDTFGHALSVAGLQCSPSGPSRS